MPNYVYVGHIHTYSYLVVSGAFLTFLLIGGFFFGANLFRNFLPLISKSPSPNLTELSLVAIGSSLFLTCGIAGSISR